MTNKDRILSMIKKTSLEEVKEAYKTAVKEYETEMLNNPFKKLRMRYHLTQNELAERFKKEGFKVNRPKISRIEEGQMPDAETLIAYHLYFNVSLEWLIGIHEE